MTDPFSSLSLSEVEAEAPIIDLRRPPHEITRDIVEVLENSNAFVSLDPTKSVFMSGGTLSRIASEELNGHTHYNIKALARYGLRGRLAELRRWQKNDNAFGAPDADIIGDLIERADELCGNLPVLEQVITYPIFSASGVLQTSPGYSRDTRCWYSPPSGVTIPEVPESPTDEDVEKAKSLIFDDLIVDFPFVDQPSRANVVTIMLEVFARRMIPGPTPIHAIDAPKEGTGKSLLADLMFLPAIGPFPKSSTASNNEDEWKKQLTTIMMSGTSYWYCDNLRSTLDSGHLASTITKAVYEERILGGNTACVRPVQHTWVITGNNIGYSGEMARRVVPTYLNAHSETPQLGRVFKHADVKAWAITHRGELIWAALVLIQRWIAKGKPRKRIGKVLGMFEAWSEIMANILDLAGIGGFLENLTDFYDEAIQEEHDSAPFVLSWYGTFGENEVTASQLCDLAQTHLELEKVIPGLGSPKPTAKRVAGYLKKINRRVYSGLEVVRIVKKGKADKYRVLTAKGSNVAANSEIVALAQSIQTNVEQNGQSWL